MVQVMGARLSVLIQLLHIFSFRFLQRRPKKHKKTKLIIGSPGVSPCLASNTPPLACPSPRDSLLDKIFFLTFEF